MKKKGKRSVAPRKVKGYYDPGKKPFPRRADASGGGIAGPVANSRNQRRARAHLSFAEQRALASQMGFRTPPNDHIPDAAKADWIAQWEKSYANY